MGYHHCPIEPNDWTSGPDDWECPRCNGDGWEDENEGDPCPRCNGNGYLSMDDDYGLDDLSCL